MNLEPKRFVNTNVAIGFVEGKGRALLAAQDLEADELIVSAPVLVLKGIEYYLMRIMPCINHLFAWPRPQMQGGDTAAIAFGLASLCNHSNAFANATVIRDYEQECIDLVATTKIETGKEILIKYKGPPPGKLVEDTPITMSASTRMTG
ncbi:MAG: hypothetical protein OER56_07785 [Hyphomicrobiales bacterium]|nr:hypothetical protein [Hyphomicrobiales bacterium]